MRDVLLKPYEVRNPPTRVRSRSGGGSFIGAVTDLYRKNLIACSLAFSSLNLFASDTGFGFSTGFSSSGGNNHVGCGLSGAFFFFFFLGSGTGTFLPMTNSGLI